MSLDIVITTRSGSLPDVPAPAPPAALTWPEAYDVYESHLRAERKSPLTVKGYLGVLHALERHLACGRAAPLPAEVTVKHLRGYTTGLLTGTRDHGRAHGDDHRQILPVPP